MLIELEEKNEKNEAQTISNSLEAKLDKCMTHRTISDKS